MNKQSDNYGKHARQRLEARRARQGKKSTRSFGAIIVIAIGLLALASCLLVFHSCQQGESAEHDVVEENDSRETMELEDVLVDKVAALDRDLLAGILESEDLADELIEKSQQNEDLYWIASHPEAYAVDGSSVQRKLLKLATKEPEAIPFVRAWPDSYPSEEGEPCGAGDVANGVPRLYQWDQRWGYTVYSSTTFALTGCGPTSLAMVYQGLTGRNDLTPYDLGARAKEDGHMTEFNGTMNQFFFDEADDLGLTCYGITVGGDQLRSALEDGAVVIANVGPGDFTEGGHFIVIAGMDENGKLIINDPFSAERSNMTWDVDVVISQTMMLIAYEL